MNEKIVLLHGIMRTSWSMRRLGKFLERNGYEVLNLHYPSTKFPIEAIIEVIHPKIIEFSKGAKLHFIGHSMGGLIIRAYINRYKPDIGKVIMLGTPNNGSEVADILKSFSLYKKLYGPAGQQLITDQNNFKNIFGKTEFELGVIAGNKAINFITSGMIKKENDGLVSVESTRTDNMKDHMVLPCDHTFLPSYKIVWRQVLNFLKDGFFIK